METIYRAKDGKEFFDEYDCAEYENELRIKNGEMPKMQDDEFNIITNFNNFEKVFYIIIENDLQLENTETLAEYYGFYDYPRRTGTYYWSSDDDNWVDISERLQARRKEIVELEALKTKMLG